MKAVTKLYCQPSNDDCPVRQSTSTNEDTQNGQNDRTDSAISGSNVASNLTQNNNSNSNSISAHHGNNSSEELRLIDSKKECARSMNGSKVLSWGCGEFGQHGHGRQDDIVPAQADMDTLYKCCGYDVRIKAFSCGGSHTVVITERDEIYGWGNGISGQLGCGDKESHASPIKVTLDKEKTAEVMGVCCGSRHTVYWLTNGQCYSSGNNFYAQLGYDFRIKNYKDNQVLPHLLQPIIHKKVVQVACGEKHTLFRIDTGLVAACGSNGFGQLGTGNRDESVSPRVLEDVDDVVFIACGSNHSLAVTGNGSLYVWGFGRPCGNRREDILFPSRRYTRETNIISAAGGGSHSLALSANGTVYSWGGGTEAQLGHGEEVIYLSQPKPLPRNAFLGRVSQIACAEAYSAAVLADGTLHMWGRSSHVIYPDKPPSWKVWRPHRVALGSRRIGRLDCGSWHVLAVTGTPDWQPNEEESDEEDSSEDEEEDVQLAKEIQQISQQEPYIMLQSPESKKEFRSSRSTRASKLNLETVAEIRTMRLPREKTKLTLEEFYAQTPLPEVFPEEVVVAGNSHVKCEHQKGVIREVSEELSEGEELEDRAVTPLADEPCSEVSSEVGKAETDLMIAQEEGDRIESQSPQGGLGRKERKTPLGEFADHPREPMREEASEPPPTRQPQRLPQPPRLARSRTMPIVQRKEIRPAPVSTTASIAHDWSAPSKEKVVPTERSRFTIDKHISLQMKRKEKLRSSSLPTTPERQAKKIAHVSLKGAGDMAPKSRSADHLYRETKRLTHHPPKITKAHSFYNSSNQSQQSSGDQIVSLVSTIKLERRKGLLGSNSSTTASGSPKAIRQSAWEANSSDLISITRTRGPTNMTNTRRPVFSSASSWRKRPEKTLRSENDAVKELGPITNSAPLHKDDLGD